jgi:hypothetical protein
VTVRRNRRAWLFAAGSTVIHVAFIAILSRAKLESPRHLATEIELSVVSEPVNDQATLAQPAGAAPVVASIEAPRPEPAPSPVLPPRRKREQRQPEPARAEAVPAPSADAKASELAAATEGSVSAPPPSAASAPQPNPSRGTALDLSAHRAAASMVDRLDMPVPACNPRGVSNGPAACPADDRAAFIARDLDAGFRRAASSPAYKTKREPPELHRQGDGSYRYDGHVFTARIRDDGHVEFLDGTTGIDGPSTIGIGVAGHVDLSDAIENGAMGKELYTSEKRWFLEQTAELRDKLAAAARTKESVEARRMLERVLERILLARELDPPHKRERILALWEDCGDDAESADTRRIVEAFVRTRMPEASELGFTKAELERFNRGRSGSRAFNPYRG